MLRSCLPPLRLAEHLQSTRKYINQISPLGGNQYVYVSCVAQSKISLAAIASGEQLQSTHNDIHSFAILGGTIALTLTRGAAKPEEGS